MSGTNSVVADSALGLAAVQYFKGCTTIYFARSNIADKLTAHLNELFTADELERDSKRFALKKSTQSNRAEMPVYVNVGCIKNISKDKSRWKLVLLFSKVGNTASIILTLPYWRGAKGWRLEESVKLEMQGRLNEIARIRRWAHAVLLRDWEPTKRPEFTVAREDESTIVITAPLGKMTKHDFQKFHNKTSR